MVKNWQAAFSRVRAALMRRGPTEQDADALVREAWVRLACYERQQSAAGPEAFLTRAALNLSIDSHRMRVSLGKEVLVEEGVVRVDATPGAEAVLPPRERAARLNVCLGRLNEKTREIFLAHRVDGMSYQEIAWHQQLSVSTVERHVAKATLLITNWMEGW